MSKAMSATPPDAGFEVPAVVLLGVIGAIQVADPLLSSLALVKASGQLNFSASMQSLAAGISTLALAATAIPGGLLADRFGRRGVLMFAVLLAAAGELITAFGPDATFYLVGRVVAGVALGMVFGSSYAMLRNVASQKSLGPAMATFGVLNGLIPVIAMVLGGVLISINWRLAYMFLPVIAIVVFFLIPLMLPKIDRIKGEGRTDYLGMFLVGLGIASILYGISGASHGLSSPLFWGPVLGGIVCFLLFGWREAKVKAPAFPIKLLAHPAFLGAVIMGTFWNMASAAMSQQLPNMWQYVTHVRPSELGAASLPMSMAGIIGSVTAGYLLGRGRRARGIAFAGYILMALGFFSYAFIPSTAVYYWFLPGMLVAGCGWMLNATAQGNLFIQLAPAKFYGPVTSSKMAVGQLGYALGLTGSTVMVSTMTLNGVATLTDGKVAGDSNWDAITDYMADPSKTPANSALAAVKPEQLDVIYTNAFNTTFMVMAIVLLVMGVIMFTLLRRKKADIPTEVFLGLAPAATSPTATKRKK